MEIVTLIIAKSITESIDLIALIEVDLGPGRRSGGWTKWVCPFHDDNDPSLAVKINSKRWYCFGCGESGDAITWMSKYHRMPFREACKQLADRNLSILSHQQKTSRKHSQYEKPPLDWQKSARLAMNTCEDLLWKKDGEKALKYLRDRGLKDETIQLYHLGLSQGRKQGGIYIPNGVVIPCIANDQIWYLKIRLVPGMSFRCSDCRQVLAEPGVCPHCESKNKYRGVKGNRTAALFGTETLDGKNVAVIAEGEFDAMLLYQEAGDLAGVITLGSASTNLDVVCWGKYLLPLSRILLAYDKDNSGVFGSDKLASITARARRLRVPRVNENDKDLTDFHLAGGNLRNWLHFEFIRLGLCRGDGDVEPETQRHLNLSKMALELRDINRLTIHIVADSVMPTIADKWRRLNDGRIEAYYSPDELLVALSIGHIIKEAQTNERGAMP